MDKFIATFVSSLPNSLKSKELERQANVFGRFLEQIMGKRGLDYNQKVKRETDDDLNVIKGTFDECLEMLLKTDEQLKDPKFIQLDGVILTIIYIMAVWPKIADESSHFIVLKDIFVGKVMVLCNSKLVGNLLTFSIAMKSLSEFMDDASFLISNSIQKLISFTSKSLVTIIGLRLADEFMEESGAEQLQMACLGLIKNKDVGVRIAAWQLLLKRADSGLTDELVKNFMIEEQLEVITAALRRPILPMEGIKIKCNELIKFIINEKLTLFHPVLFKRLVMLPSEEMLLDRELLSNLLDQSIKADDRDNLVYAAIWLTVQKTRYFELLNTDEKIRLVSKYFSSLQDPSILYAGLSLLEGCVGRLGARVTDLQDQLMKVLLLHEDPQICSKCLMVLLGIANPSNWEALSSLGLAHLLNRLGGESLEEHVWKIKVLRQCSKILVEFCHGEDFDLKALKIVNAIPESSTINEINDILEIFKDRDIVISEEFDNPNRALVLSGWIKNQSSIRKELVDTELLEQHLDDPFRVFRSSLFEQIGELSPRVTASECNTSPLILAIERVEIVKDYYPIELQMDIFSGL